jgi:ferredoxin
MADFSIEVDRELCIGSGVCIAYAGGTFDHDLEGKAIVRSPSSDALDTIRSAVEGCPMGALRLNES